ncbi:sensor domain-containing protein [Clostridium grantii]
MLGIYLYCFLPIPREDFANAAIGKFFMMNTGRGFLYNTYYYIYFIYNIAFMFALLFLWRISSKVKREKVQSTIILISMIVATFCSIIADNFLIKSSTTSIDPYSVIILLIPITAMSYTINKYRLMNLNPKHIALEVINLMNEGLIVLNNENKIEDINKGAENLLGYSLNEIKGENINLIFPEDLQIFTSNNFSSYETVITSNKGEKTPILLSSTILLDDFKEKLSTVVIFQELSKIKKMQNELLNMNSQLETRVLNRTRELNTINQELTVEIVNRVKIEADIKYLYEHDELTNLPNRRLFNKTLEKTIQESNHTQYFALAILDIDSFKNINDTFGHTSGDNILKEISIRMKSELMNLKMLARTGGDEFLVLFDISNIKYSFKENVELIRKCFDPPFYLNKEKLYLTTSVGVAIYPDDGDDIETLMKNADIALYKAKDEGKSIYKFCDDYIKNQVLEEIDLTNNLYQALELNEIEVYYQPQINQCTNRIVGVEALARWNHKKYGFVSAVKFIPIAEKTGLIQKIGDYILRTACTQSKKWHDLGYNITMAINISVVQLNNTSFIHTVDTIVRETGVSANNIELEITESVLIKNLNYIISTLFEIKKLGIRLSMDDFGTDYSSLKYLRDLPLDKVKIAREFVSQIGINENDEEIISAIVKLIKKLNFNIIAEGVETKEQLEFLNILGCAEIQGYYFYKPMPLAKIQNLLMAQK